MDVFEIIGEIVATETIAEGSGIRDRARLLKQYGKGNWKKKKGLATIKAENGVRARVELHWYEAHGIGKRELKIKQVLRFLD
jgi:hypothetical protein